MKTIVIDNELWQTRVAVLNNDRLQDIFFDTSSTEDLERCFFKGKVAKVLGGIQTAFIDIGQNKAGFLHISEVDRSLATEKVLNYLQDGDDSREDFSHQEIKSSMDMAKIFNEGDEVLVQVIKEPIYEKGAKLTTCFTLPGKFIVLMPNIPQVGVSKKIEDRDERARLKEIITNMLPEEMGAIIRTTADKRSYNSLKKDITLLLSTWNDILKKYKTAQVGEKIYQDLPLPLRVVRDHLDEDVERVVTNNPTIHQELCDFTERLTPEFVNKVHLYKGTQPLFERFNINDQIEKALQKKVPLKSGGSIIIETTEAMTVIDVNTGKFVGSSTMEDTILKTNMEAAEEIVIQLRLRNIGGIIVIDFIDMAIRANQQKLSNFLEKTLRERDRFQSVALRVSEFGIIQMTRKRSGKTLVQQLTNPCLVCQGYGYTLSTPTKAYQILRSFTDDMKKRPKGGALSLSVPAIIFDYLVHKEYKTILQLEKDFDCRITLEKSHSLHDAQFKIHKD